MYILTGGAGFIGSVFLARLNAEGIDDVLVVDNLGSSAKWRNLLGKRFSDYRHKDAFVEEVKQRGLPPGVTHVVHLGACSATTELDADYMLRNNTQYSRVLAEAALKTGARFIYASSAATYGDGALGYDDSHATLDGLRPLNVYGFSKHLFDLWSERNSLLTKIAGLKFFNVYGPNEYHKGDMRSVVSKAFDQIRETGTVKLFRSISPQYKDGEQMRDFIYAKDCADVLWWLCEKPGVNGIFNLGSGRARTWNDLVSAVFKAMGAEKRIEWIETPERLRKQYQNFTEAKMDKLRAAGYSKEFCSLEDGVADYVSGYLSHDEAIA